MSRPKLRRFSGVPDYRIRLSERLRVRVGVISSCFLTKSISIFFWFTLPKKLQITLCYYNSFVLIQQPLLAWHKAVIGGREPVLVVGDRTCFSKRNFDQVSICYVAPPLPTTTPPPHQTIYTINPIRSGTMRLDCQSIHKYEIGWLLTTLNAQSRLFLKNSAVARRTPGGGLLIWIVYCRQTRF